MEAIGKPQSAEKEGVILWVISACLDGIEGEEYFEIEDLSLDVYCTSDTARTATIAGRSAVRSRADCGGRDDPRHKTDRQ